MINYQMLWTRLKKLDKLSPQYLIFKWFHQVMILQRNNLEGDKVVEMIQRIQTSQKILRVEQAGKKKLLKTDYWPNMTV